MAVLLAITYSKKLGLPNFSSHSCSVSLTVEIPDANAVGQESTKLYRLLQNAVDREIQEVGFMPDATRYGMNKPAEGAEPVQGKNGHGNGSLPWKCSDKQRDLILKIVDEQRLEIGDIDDLARERFGKTARELNKLEASGLIDELLESSERSTGNGSRRVNGTHGNRQGRGYSRNGS